MFKMNSDVSFEYLKHKLWPKKGHEWKCQFDYQPLKNKNFPYLHVCKWCATYGWKNLDEGYNFALYLISIEGFHKKLWTSKVAGVPISGI
jgi:hypothetical protein